MKDCRPARPDEEASRPLSGLSSVVSAYTLILCDVFGVLHDADRIHLHAVQALVCARQSGLAVVLLSNSAVPGATLRDLLVARGLPKEAWDEVVTSADVTRGLLLDRGIRVACHIGPAPDRVLIDGLDLALDEADRAEIVVCTGLEDPADEDRRAAALTSARWRGLDLVCTNPDLVAVAGGKTLRFAGTVAAAYAGLGGTVVSTGKPDSSIYRYGLEVAEQIAGRQIEVGQVLAIGDTYALDVVGARRQGFDALWITPSSGRAHREEGRPAIRRMPELAWT